MALKMIERNCGRRFRVERERNIKYNARFLLDSASNREAQEYESVYVSYSASLLALVLARGNSDARDSR